MRKENRIKEFSFSKKSYIATGYPAAVEPNSGYFRGAEIISAIGGDITLVFVPEQKGLDTIKAYLTAADAYELGKLLIDRAEAASQELLSLRLEEK